MAKETVKQFPDLPKRFDIDPSRDNIEQLRKKMAVDIFLASESKEDYFSICALKDLPQRTSTDIIDWVQCEKCARWFHSSCVGFNATQTSGMDSPRFCELCNI